MTKRRGTVPLSWGGANPKEAVWSTIIAMHEHGLGSRTIAEQIGYSERHVRVTMRDLGLSKHTPSTMVAALVRHMPAELKEQIASIRRRHELRKAIVKRELGELTARTVHRIMDSADDTCPNPPREGTPGTGRIPTLGEMLLAR